MPTFRHFHAGSQAGLATAQMHERGLRPRAALGREPPVGVGPNGGQFFLTFARKRRARFRTERVMAAVCPKREVIGLWTSPETGGLQALFRITPANSVRSHVLTCR